MTGKKYVYAFEDGKGVGKELLGGKGSNMADMVALGLPIPPGFLLMLSYGLVTTSAQQKP